MKYHLVQPWGTDKGRQGTVLGEHPSIVSAFAALDELAERMQKTGAPSDAIEIVVVDEQGNVVSRPGAQ